MAQISHIPRNLPVYPFSILAKRRKEIIDRKQRLFDFSKGDPIEPTPSFIRQTLINAVPEVSQYPAPRGTPEVRTAAAQYLQRRFGVAVNPETEVLHTNGSKEAIYNLISAIVGPRSGSADTKHDNTERRGVIYADPAYPVVERSNIIFGADPIPVPIRPENGFLLDLDTLPEAVLRQAAICWLNYPNNPTGASCTLEYLQKQAAICERYGILLCSDECYVDLYLGDVPHPSALQVSTKNIVAFHSCSKRSGMTGYRSGFVAGDVEVLKAYISLRDAIGTETPAFIQAAATAAWNDDDHADERRTIFRAKRDAIVDALQERGLKIERCDATFYLWAKVPKKFESGSAYAEALLPYGILVAPGEYFGTCCKEYVRIALVPTLPEIKNAAEFWPTL